MMIGLKEKFPFPAGNISDTLARSTFELGETTHEFELFEFQKAVVSLSWVSQLPTKDPEIKG